MIVYILKFSACLAIFLGFYKLFLEKENMHQFKRFYLIGALLIAFGIPFVTFTHYVEPVILENTLQISQAVVSQNSIIAETSLTNYIPLILWSLYGIGVLLFGIKFLTNLSKLILKINRNPKHKSRYAINVLLQDLVTPHTFFSYIFLNKVKYETQQIPQEVLLHEETHAKQKHSFDILLIEILQVILWFNPLIYLIKDSIKLNHEFLADKAVLKKGIQPTNYQQILLAFSTNQREPQLANAINYSSIKKRITVMKTHTSKQKIWFRSIVLLPLLALLIFSFSSTKHIEKEIISESTESHFTARSIEIKVFDNGTYEVDGITATKKSFISVINRLHQDITPEIRNQIINIHVNNGTTVSDEEVWFIYNSVLEYGFHRIVAHNQKIIKAKGNTPFAITSADNQKHTKVISKNTEEQKSATKEQIAEYNKLAKYYNSQSKDQLIIKQKDLERLEYLYHLMSKKQKENAEPFPVLPPPPAPDAPKNIAADKILPPPPPPPMPENATPEQKEKYNKVIEEYKRKYTVKEGRVYENPPPSPPPIPDNATPEQRKKYEDATKSYKLRTKENNLSRTRALRSKEDVSRLRKDKLATKEVRTAKLRTEKQDRVLKLREDKSRMKQDRLASLDAQKARRTNEKSLARDKEIKMREAPRSTLDHVIDMAKRDSKFFLEGKEISSDKAIDALKKNEALNIKIVDSKSKEPKVYITKKPIQIEN